MSQTEIDFIACCPVEGCPNGNNPIKWVHSNCGGFEKLNLEGDLRCVKCDHSAFIADWKFKCESHDYKKGSYQGFCYLLAVLGKTKGVKRKDIQKILDKIPEDLE